MVTQLGLVVVCEGFLVTRLHGGYPSVVGYGAAREKKERRQKQHLPSIGTPNVPASILNFDVFPALDISQAYLPFL